jgi:AraC family transcriptional regulator, regulatory protein of adaptative response / DNA-3-methyladenine glycosylase II
MKRVPLDVDLAASDLDYRPPFDWDHLRDFLRIRAVPGVERVEDDVYLRTVRAGDHTGWIRVTPGKRRDALRLEVSPSLMRVRELVARRVRRLFDLDADPALVAASLGRDRRLSRLVALRPGLRVPRAFDSAELAARAILGQQVTVAAARTLAGRMARSFGDPIATPYESLDRLWPTAARLAGSPESVLVAIPLVRARARALVFLMSAIVEGTVSLDDAADVEQTMAKMIELPGIGLWTAHYIAMRGIGWSDAFPEGDLVLRRALGNATARACRTRAERWRPFRAYAALHLWANHTKGQT